MKNNTNYFSHDCNARNDERLMVIRAEYGREGYGIYFAVIEMLSEATDYKLNLDNIDVITKLYHINNDVITKLFKLGLLDKDKESFWSSSLLKRMNIKDKKAKKYSEAGKKGMEKRWGGKNVSDELGNDNDVITSKVKEIKVKEIKINNKETLSNDKEAKPSYGNKDINSLISVIEMYNNGICDGTQKEQRQYGKLLLGKLQKVDKVKDGEYTRDDYLSGLLKVVKQNNFHGHKIGGPKKIYYALAELIHVANQTIKEDSKNTGYVLPGID